MLKTSVIYKDNQGAIFLVNNRQVRSSTKHIDAIHPFLQDIIKDKDIDIQYIFSEDNPEKIMAKKKPEADFTRHMKIVTDGELWEIVDT